METMQTAKQAGSQAQNESADQVNPDPNNGQVESAPLYASPWLAFFYIIRQGLGQLRP